MRRTVEAAETTRQEARTESRRWRSAMILLVVAMLAFGGGVYATIELQQFFGMR